MRTLPLAGTVSSTASEEVPQERQPVKRGGRRALGEAGVGEDVAQGRMQRVVAPGSGAGRRSVQQKANSGDEAIRRKRICKTSDQSARRARWVEVVVCEGDGGGAWQA